MLKNKYFAANVGFDRAENWPHKVCEKIANRFKRVRINIGYGPVQSIAVSDYGYAACGMETGVLPIVNLVEDKIIGSTAV